MNSIKIQGKDYIPVNERIKEFWTLHPAWNIRTEMLPSEPGTIRFQACIVDEKGILRATGHAEEKENSTYINKTSYVENCETSAVGRALGLLGIGIDTSLASFEEVANAMVNQDIIDRSPKSYDDGKSWMSEAQLLKTIERYQNGEKDVIEKALNTFKISKAYRQRLADLTDSPMSS